MLAQWAQESLDMWTTAGSDERGEINPAGLRVSAVVYALLSVAAAIREMKGRGSDDEG